jgi:hypothetical protein
MILRLTKFTVFESQINKFTIFYFHQSQQIDRVKLRIKIM